MSFGERVAPAAAAVGAFSTLLCCLPLSFAGALGAAGLSAVAMEYRSVASWRIGWDDAMRNKRLAITAAAILRPGLGITIGVLIAACAATVAGCAGRSSAPAAAARSTGGIVAADLVFLTREGCAATATMRANTDAALRALGMPAAYRVIDIGTLPESDARGGYPTPTLLYENRDVFGMPEPPVPHPPAT